MSPLQLVVLAIVQGVTDYLPISSSAHLILTPRLLGWPDQGLTIDVATHIGTLVAVVLFFWRDLVAMLAGLFDWSTPGLLGQPGRRLAVFVVLGTIPAVLFGLAIKATIGTDVLRDPELIAWTTIGFGIVLWLADRLGAQDRRLGDLKLGQALAIGLAQALSLIPGVSRSGITMTAARALGFERYDAARFSLLLSIPVTFAAGALTVLELWQSGDTALGRDALIVALLSAVSAYIAIWALMAWLRHASFTPFVLYRLLLGALLLWLF
jgi:undecaprenyl-diphosphatase